jgi:DNA topoisomerase IA
LTWKNSDESAAALGASATPRKALVEHIVDVASSPRASAVVVDVNENPVTIAPPPGLNTVALLEAGSKAMGMYPKQVMNVAEKRIYIVSENRNDWLRLATT